MSDRVQGFNARDCGDWGRNLFRRPVVWAQPWDESGSLDLTVTMDGDGTSIILSREDARALASYILALTD